MRAIIIGILVITTFTVGNAQDVPLLSQKLTDAFIYNSSFAGLDNGSITFAHRAAFNKMEGGGKINFLSFNMPLSYNNFGVGLSLYNEKINFMNNTYVSGAFAYHIEIGNDQLFSMGVAAEYNNIRADVDRVVGDLSDEMLTLLDAGQYNKMDYSAGINYQHRYFKIGISSNRLATAFKGDDDQSILVQYYTAQGALMIPVRGGIDLIEPMFIYRKFSRVSHSWDLGCYYTFNDLILFGISARVGGSAEFSSKEQNPINIFNITGGFKLMSKLLLGYSVDIASSSASLGPSHEFTLSYEFLDINNNQRFNQKSPSNYKGRFKKKGNKRK